MKKLVEAGMLRPIYLNIYKITSKLVEARGVEPLSLKPLAQTYYKLSQCWLLALHH